jgi:tetratricopeptide (TPR) repeat protein
MSQPDAVVNRRRIRGWIALLVLLGVGAYAPSLDHPFVWDDEGAILTNPTIRSLWPLGPVLTPPPATPVTGRPLTNLSFALSYAVSGLHPVGYHAGTLLLHLANSLLLFGLLRRTLRILWPARGPQALGWAWTVAALWLLHPVHTECLNYATQRSEVLASSGLLLTLYCALRSCRTARPGRWWLGAVAACAGGMASKEIMVGAPLLVWLADRTWFAGSFRAALRRRGPLYLGLALTWLVLLAQAAGAQYPPVLEVAFRGPQPWWVYALTQSQAVAHYLRLAVWPQPLVLDYYDWPLATALGPAWPAVLVTGTLLAGTLWGLWRRASLGVLGAWWFLLLAPTTSLLFIHTEPLADRRLYLPVVAVLLLGVGLAERGLRARGWPRSGLDRRLAAALVTALLGLELGLVLARNRDYQSDLALWRTTVAQRPGNARAHNNLGTALLASGDLSSAAAAYQQAMQLNPAYGQAIANFGIIQAKLGRLRLALEFLDAALLAGGEYAEVHEQRGDVLADLGDHEGAAAAYRRALELNPFMAVAHRDLAIVLERLGQFTEAEARYREAIKLEPEGAEARHRRGLLLERQRRSKSR